jgi:hypothetical protein
MAPVNGRHYPACEDPFDDSDSHLLGPHGSEWQNAMSDEGSGGGGTATWARGGPAIYQDPHISMPSGAAQYENSKSTALHGHRSPLNYFRKPQSLYSIVSIGHI